MGKIAASILLKLFINGNERRQTTDAPLELFSNKYLNKTISKASGVISTTILKVIQIV